MLDVVLHPGRDRSLRRRHPWLLSGAVARVDGGEEPGALARVISSGGEVMGYGHLSPKSTLRVRMLCFGKEPPAEDLIAQRIARSIARREGDPLLGDTDAMRLVNSEGDGLPGLLVDRYADRLVVKFTSAGMATRRDEIAGILQRESGASLGFERPDASAARREGMPVHQGPLWGEAPSGPVEIREEDRRYLVNTTEGQKTGFYLDQRDARSLVQSVASGRRTLDLFAYTGGFAVAAARGGASAVTLVESSEAALALARENLAANAEAVTADFVHGDVFRAIREPGSPFDLIVIDPPPLARHKRDAPKAARAYKDVLLFSLRRAAPDALVLAFSCSHHVGPDLFRKIAAGAALDAGRTMQVLRELAAPVDHPVSLDHPEGAYLSGLLLRA